MLIRLANQADAGAVHEIYAPVVERTAISFEHAAPTVAEMARRIAAHGETHPWLVAEDSGTLIGYAYAGAYATRAAYAWTVETSIYVAAAARRHGAGRALYTTLFDVLGAQGYHRAVAGITLPNPASVGLHEAMGFELVGVFRAVGWKLGAWHDVGRWQRDLPARCERGGTPEPPRRLGDLDPRVLSAALEGAASGSG